jgi:HlyD family secretion protein
MKKILSILLGLVLLSAFAGTLYFLYSKSDDPPVVHETASPSVKTILRKTVATGSVVPRKEVAIKPQVSGIISNLWVEPGQAVKRGDQIARIQIVPDMVTLNNAENRVNMARIALENAEWELERAKRLEADGVISQNDFKARQLAYDNASEELTGAIDNLELIRKGSTQKTNETTTTLVRSTIDGTVLEVPVEEGHSVIETNTFNEGTTIATVADMDELIFEGKIDESEVGKIRPGMELLLTIGAIEGEQFRATLEHIAPKGVEENGAIQFQIRAALAEQNDRFIRANYSANADIVLDRRDDVLAIDESLLQFDEGKPYVEVETAPQQFERRDIETGISDGISIEITSGLTEQDKIKKPSA